MADAAAERATTLKQAFRVCNLGALTGTDLDRYYVDLSAVRSREAIDNTDVVVWYVFGHHHIPRPEDWPVMPVAYSGFTLKPLGFFDQNPALDVPPSPPKQTCH
jgi:hypothetical protein